jgi:hypothetical protein
MGPDANLWAYLGPDTILPATSILAAVGGIVLAFWNYLAGAAVKNGTVCSAPAGLSPRARSICRHRCRHPVGPRAFLWAGLSHAPV